MCGGLRVQSPLDAVSMTGFVLEEDGLVIRLAGRDQVIHDTRKFVSGGGDGHGPSEFGPHPSIVAPERGATALHRLRRHAESQGRAVLHPPGLDAQQPSRR